MSEGLILNLLNEWNKILSHDPRRKSVIMPFNKNDITLV
jgi:hypothetical protein